jgi:ABC-type transport system involved in cytochrome bd biosynthesis fused ATPase/permease subunit
MGDIVLEFISYCSVATVLLIFLIAITSGKTQKMFKKLFVFNFSIAFFLCFLYAKKG